MTNTAAVRAQLTDLWERAHSSTPDDQWPPVTKMTNGSAVEKVPEGFDAWSVGRWPESPSDAPESGRLIVVLPSLNVFAPMSVHRRLRARVIANGTGRCPLCNQAAGLSAPVPEPGGPRAYFHAGEVTVTLNHDRGCPAEFSDSERYLFPVFNHPERG